MREVTPVACEAAARALASLEPDEDWPTNAELGGSLTGTRDDEYRYGITDRATEVLVAALPHLTPEDVPHIVARVLRDAASAAALELGNEVSGHTSTYSVRHWLRARADSLDPEAHS